VVSLDVISFHSLPTYKIQIIIPIITASQQQQQQIHVHSNSLSDDRCLRLYMDGDVEWGMVNGEWVMMVSLSMTLSTHSMALQLPPPHDQLGGDLIVGLIWSNSFGVTHLGST